VTSQRILILDAHPDPDAARYLHALVASYADGARAAGHAVVTLQLATLAFPMLTSSREFNRAAPADSIRRVQEQINWCTHFVIFYPLWLGCMPAMLKSLLEQVMRPAFVLPASKGTSTPRRPLAGKSARIVVTMGMPAWVYRWYFRAHGVKLLKRNILGFVGIAPIGIALVGSVEALSDAGRQRWLQRIYALGSKAA
jgi:putative NADPH-quinone reductase